MAPVPHSAKKHSNNCVDANQRHHAPEYTHDHQRGALRGQIPVVFVDDLPHAVDERRTQHADGAHHDEHRAHEEENPTWSDRSHRETVPNGREHQGSTRA